MLKPVPIERVAPGMWFHRLGGAGYHHAFVKSGFLLEAGDILLLAQGGIDELIIDTTKGLDVVPEAPAPEQDAGEEAQAAVPLSPAPASAPAPAVLTCPSAIEDEIQSARRLVQQGKEKVVALFGDARLGRAIHPESVMSCSRTGFPKPSCGRLSFMPNQDPPCESWLNAPSEKRSRPQNRGSGDRFTHRCGALLEIERANRVGSGSSPTGC